MQFAHRVQGLFEAVTQFAQRMESALHSITKLRGPVCERVDGIQALLNTGNALLKVVETGAERRKTRERRVIDLAAVRSAISFKPLHALGSFALPLRDVVLEHDRPWFGRR